MEMKRFALQLRIKYPRMFSEPMLDNSWYKKAGKLQVTMLKRPKKCNTNQG